MRVETENNSNGTGGDWIDTLSGEALGIMSRVMLRSVVSGPIRQKIEKEGKALYRAPNGKKEEIRCAAHEEEQPAASPI